MKKEIYGMGRSRDRKGKVIDWHLLPYVMCLHTMMESGYENMQVLVAEIIRYDQSYELQTQDMTNTITSVYKDNIVMEEQMMQEPIEARPKGKGWKWIPEEKCWIRLRKLTPRECFRLMGVVETDIDKIQQAVFNKNDVIPLGYRVADKEKGERNISNSQQYKMAGNSIVTNCLCEIFRKLFIEKENEQRQLELF